VITVLSLDIKYSSGIRISSIMEPVLKVESVSKVFHDRVGNDIIAIEDLSFEVAEGELLVLLGPSGCGKTTLLRIIAGLETVSNGRILLDNKEIKGPGRERGMVFQHYSSFPWLTVSENIKFGLKYRSDIKKEEWDKIAKYFINLVGLHGFEESYISQLSGGMQQRVSIARTLSTDPRILLMDEPFGALDTQNREFLQLQLLEAQSVAKKTIIFVTHDVEEAIFLADRLLILTARPAKIKKEFIVNLPKPRILEMKTTAEFLNIKRQVLSYTREEAQKTDMLWRRPQSEAEKFRDEHKFSMRRHLR